MTGGAGGSGSLVGSAAGLRGGVARVPAVVVAAGAVADLGAPVDVAGTVPVLLADAADVTAVVFGVEVAVPDPSA